MSSLPTWIELPSNAQHRKPSPEVDALRDCFLLAREIGYHLLCASIEACRTESPDVTVCAGIVREAIHKPEKERANAVKAAEASILERQLNWVSKMIYFQEHKDSWQAIRPKLVAHLEDLVALGENPGAGGIYFDIDLRLNCEAVFELIDSSDVSVNEINKRRLNQPTEKLAKAGFQKVIDALTCEVGSKWLSEARWAVNPGHSTEMLRDIPVDKVSSCHVSAEFEKCTALSVARAEFEHALAYPFTSNCRDWAQQAKGKVNEPQMAEGLLAAMPDLNEMLRLEARRDAKLREYARSWRTIRSQVDALNVSFVKTAELLPEALAEAAAIEDETIRLRAQNLCLFAARRLKENLKFVRDCNRFVPEYEEDRHRPDNIASAIDRNHQALVERVRAKQLQRPTTRVKEENYYGG